MLHAFFKFSPLSEKDKRSIRYPIVSGEIYHLCYFIKTHKPKSVNAVTQNWSVSVRASPKSIIKSIFNQLHRNQSSSQASISFIENHGLPSASVLSQHFSFIIALRLFPLSYRDTQIIRSRYRHHIAIALKWPRCPKKNITLKENDTAKEEPRNCEARTRSFCWGKRAAYPADTRFWHFSWGSRGTTDYLSTLYLTNK